MLNDMKPQVAAWEPVYNICRCYTSMLQALVAATPPVAVPEVKSMDEAEARETSNVTVAGLQDEIILCERILKEAKDWAEKTKERLRGDITEWKDMATKFEAVLWEEILLARSS
jgi:hypothetical protein